MVKGSDDQSAEFSHEPADVQGVVLRQKGVLRLPHQGVRTFDFRQGSPRFVPPLRACRFLAERDAHLVRPKEKFEPETLCDAGLAGLFGVGLRNRMWVVVKELLRGAVFVDVRHGVVGGFFPRQE